jgi:hypothetical protein
MSASMGNRLKRLEGAIPPPAKDHSRAREILDRLPLEAKRLIVEAFRKKSAELGRRADFRELDWTEDQKKLLRDALAKASGRGDQAPPAPPEAEKPAPAEAAEPAAPGPEEAAHPPAVAETVPSAPKEPCPQVPPRAQPAPEPVRLAFPRPSRDVYGIPERYWRRLRL